jgi:hypothetical protein
MQDIAITLSDEVVQPLRRTRPWVKFIAIMGFIGCGFIVLDALFVFWGFAILPGAKTSQALPLGPMMALVLLYLVIAFFTYFIPSLLLARYASTLGRIETNATLEKLAEAAERQRRFWKYCGVLLIVGISVFVLFVIGAAIAIPIIAATHHMP